MNLQSNETSLKIATLFRPTVVDEVALRVELAKAGFAGPQVAFLNLYGILRRTTSQPPDFLAETMSHLLSCADPDLALNNLEHLVRRHYEDRDLPWTFAGDPYRTLVHLLGASQAIADTIVRLPELIAVLSETHPHSTDEPSRNQFRARLLSGESLVSQMTETLIEAQGEEARLKALKKFRDREMIRIAAMDLVWGIDIVTVSRFMSRLADALIVGSLIIAKGELGLEEAANDRGFSVIGLGKLGGDELNISSDVDVLFITECADDDGLYTKIARKMISLLHHRDGGGQLLRVDVRLRPQGDSGPLTRSLRSSLEYYQTLGRPWERQMLVKARPLAGDTDLGEQFLEEVRPFVIGKSLDAAAIAQIQDLRRQMERAASPDGDDRLEIKRGHGGIRDIEYTVQFLQLLHARSHPSVVHHNTTESLARLERVGAITREEGETLAQSYRFLRRVENRLQLLHQVATHRVPKNDDAARGLARSLGFQDTSEFRDELSQTRSRARSVYNKLCGHLFQEPDGIQREVYDLILESEPEDDTVASVLGRYRFRDVHGAFKNLKKLGESDSKFLPTSPRARKFFAGVIPQILGRVARTPDPDQALSNLERFSRGTAGKALFFRLLREEPEVLEILVDIAGHSQLLSDILIREPESLDPFVDSLLVERRGRQRRQRGLTIDLLRSADEPMVSIADFKTLETLRIGTRDIQGRVPLQQTLHALSRVATTVVRRAWALADSNPDQDPPCAASILAFGKLGGLEINYGSDLDLLFVCEDGSVESMSYWTERARKFMRLIGTPTPGGRLYKLDARLRPEGESGPLVASWSALTSYYGSDRVHTFEKQSLLRLRFVAGDRNLASRVIQWIGANVLSQPPPKDLKEQLHSMRAKLESTRKGQDIKRGPGGIIDIEFVVQYLQLLHHDSPELRSPNTWRAIRLLSKGGKLNEAMAKTLEEGYTLLRRMESCLQIAYGLDHESLPTVPAELEKLSKRLHLPENSVGDSALVSAFESTTRSIRGIYSEFLATAAIPSPEPSGR